MKQSRIKCLTLAILTALAVTNCGKNDKKKKNNSDNAPTQGITSKDADKDLFGSWDMLRAKGNFSRSGWSAFSKMVMEFNDGTITLSVETITSCSASVTAPINISADKFEVLAEKKKETKSDDGSTCHANIGKEVATYKLNSKNELMIKVDNETMTLPRLNVGGGSGLAADPSESLPKAATPKLGGDGDLPVLPGMDGEGEAMPMLPGFAIPKPTDNTDVKKPDPSDLKDPVSDEGNGVDAMSIDPG